MEAALSLSGIHKELQNEFGAGKIVSLEQVYNVVWEHLKDNNGDVGGFK